MKKPVLGLLLVLTASSCKTTTPSQVHTSALSPVAILGSAYDAYNGEYTGMSCVDISALLVEDYEYIPAKWNELRDRRDVDHETLQGIFGNFQSSFFTEATGLRLSRPREAINRILSGPNDITQFAVLSSRKGSFRIKAASLKKLRLTPEAQALVNDKEAFILQCGTEFLSGTSYTVGIAATLRLVFVNPVDRSAFSGTVEEITASGPTATLHYETYLKETRDVNFRVLGDLGSKDCTPGNFDPCLDAFRIFQNRTVPKYQKMMVSPLRNSDRVLPLAYLVDAEKTPYRHIVPAFASVELSPSEADKQEWSELREGFVKLQAKLAKSLQTANYLQIQSSKGHELLQEISTLAAPCYRPILDKARCQANLKSVPPLP